jgi:hypothetical protein
VGYAGYRFGYAQGVQTAADGDVLGPGARLFEDFNRRGMPDLGDRFERGFRRDFGSGGFRMRGSGFFSLLLFLAQIAVLALIAGLVYWLFTHSGWRLTRTPAAQTTETPPPPAETRGKEENQES